MNDATVRTISKIYHTGRAMKRIYDSVRPSLPIELQNAVIQIETDL